MQHDTPINLFLNHIILRAGIKKILWIGVSLPEDDYMFQKNIEIFHFGPATSALKYSPSEKHFFLEQPVQFIETNLEQAFAIDQALLENAIVVCVDVLDDLQNPVPLIQTLAIIRKQCKFMLITVADRFRNAGFYGSGLTSNTFRQLKWSGDEFFRTLVQAGFPQAMLFGYISTGEIPEIKNSVLAIAGQEAEPIVVKNDFRVAAVINVFNELDIIETSVRHLVNQGVEVHIVDNWSDDGSFELCQHLLGQNQIVNLIRFPAKKTEAYEWAKQLQHTADYAAKTNANWIIHYDADELRDSPWQNLRLADAIKFIDTLGYTAIDFTVLDFRFTDRNNAETFSAKKYNFFEFGKHQSCFRQIKAWKNWHQSVELVESGGHEATFEGQRVYPLKFLTRHYSLRNKKQATKKIFSERIPRIQKEKKDRGWHVHFDHYQHLHEIAPWKSSELTPFNTFTFPHEFLIERLSGIGVQKEDHLTLNQNNTKILEQLLEDLASMCEDQNATINKLKDKNDQIAELTFQLDTELLKIKNSRSWRLTYPLREAMRYAKLLLKSKKTDTNPH